MGIPGTGNRVEFDCVLIFDFEDGRSSASGGSTTSPAC